MLHMKDDDWTTFGKIPQLQIQTDGRNGGGGRKTGLDTHRAIKNNVLYRVYHLSTIFDQLNNIYIYKQYNKNSDVKRRRSEKVQKYVIAFSS